MDRKHGKYVVNIEHSENKLPIMCSGDQEAQRSACWRPLANGITGDSSSSLTGVCVSPGVLEHPAHPHTESSHTQVKENCCCNWSLWNVFLACFLACVITTTVGALVICLVNNRGSDNSSIVIKLSPDSGEPEITVHGKTPAASQPAVTTPSTESTTISTSTEPAATIATTITSTAPTATTRSTGLTTTTAITPTSTKTTDAPTSVESTAVTIITSNFSKTLF